MAYYSLITCLAFFSLISNLCHCFHPKLLNVSKYDQYGSGWQSTRATWYGQAYGPGTTTGGCGYQDAVASAPFNSKVAAAAGPIFDNGGACGTCYQLICTNSPHCSEQGVTVVIADSCMDCDHLFDLSGISFGAMAIPGQEEQLRNLGILQVQYRSVECNFRGVNVAFRVQQGSNPNYLATTIEYEDGDGLTEVAVRQANSYDNWMPMQLLWGAVYSLNSPNPLTGPFSFKLTDAASKTIVAENVIPANYDSTQTYRSVVNFGV